MPDRIKFNGEHADFSQPQLLPKTSGKAVASLILGALPFVAGFTLFAGAFGALGSHINSVLYCSDFVAATLAVILGHHAKATIRSSGGHLRGKALASSGLALGYVWVAGAILVMSISAFIAHSRMAANQASRVGSLRVINTAALSFAQTYKHGYPRTLAVLGPPNAEGSNPNAEPTENAAGLIDEILASGIKSGYRFTYVPGPMDSDGKISTYTVHADPLDPSISGNLHYFTDQTGLIRVEERKEADERSKPVE